MRLLDFSASFHGMIRNGDLRMIRGSIKDRKIKEEKMIPSLYLMYDEVPLAFLHDGTGPGRITQLAWVDPGVYLELSFLDASNRPSVRFSD